GQRVLVIRRVLVIVGQRVLVIRRVLVIEILISRDRGYRRGVIDK
ncbi:hypothetical protein CWI39_1871p0010, partial [Hamiltosporidium magnivora]